MNSFYGVQARYPYHTIAFSTLPLPIFQEAVNECIEDHQIPPALAYAAALGALSLVLQYLIKVRKPTG
ncbi:MAG: hypothetical protein ABI076_01905, partial [Acidobacteriaceae bacterium]